MKFLKWIFRHRYRIDLVRDILAPEGRYVVRELPWQCFAFPVYLSIGHSSSLEGAKELIEQHKNRLPDSETAWKN